MYISTIALVAFLGQTSPDSLPPVTAKGSLYTNPADTLPAIDLQVTPYFVRDTSGEAREWLDTCYTVFRNLLQVAKSKGWVGSFSFDELAKRYTPLLKYPKFRPAFFQINGKAVYASYLENPGFTPTIGLVNNPDEERVEFFYATSNGESRAWATPIR